MIASFKIARMRRLKSLNRLVPGLLASLAVIALMQTGTWMGLERRINTQMILWRGSMPWDTRLAMVSVDDKTLKEYGPFPIDRNAYAEMLQVLTEEGASVVAFNVSFSDTSPLNRTSFKGEDVSPSSRSTENASLASAIQRHGRVVIGQSWDETGSPEVPVPVLEKVAISVGHLQLAGAGSDGLTRRVEITYQGMPALGIAATQAYTLDKTPLSIPNEQDSLTINWPTSARNLATFSLVDVKNKAFPQGFFKDKIVIVSYGAFAGPVQIETPFDQRPPVNFSDEQKIDVQNSQSLLEPSEHHRGSVQSGYLHAAVIHNLLQQNWLRQVPGRVLVFFVLLAGPAFSGLLYRRRTVTRLLLCAGVFSGWLLLCMVALHANYLLPVLVPLATMTLVGAVVSVLGRLESNALLQVRSAFLNTMSHEIRTPLNAIVNLSEMLQETQLDDRQREFAETLNTSSHALLALINDVLDFSKIESGRLMIDACPVRLSETVERSLEILAPRAAEKGIELAYSITPSTPAVIMSDPVRLQQVLLNLLSNAVKFTEVGEISVQVQASAIAPSHALLPWSRARALRKQPSRVKRASSVRNGHYLSGASLPGLKLPDQPSGGSRSELYEIRFAVHDTGIGIPSERMSQLFKPFSQVSASTTRKYGGTGLGLSISKRLSERMGGDLWVRSYPGEGSTFYFTVQASLAEADELLPTHLSQHLMKLSGTRLLLIDRNITRSNHFTWQLQPLGISLAQATSLSEALSFMQNDPMFDGILLDERVASSQGECAMAIRSLRKMARNEHLPLILLSALQTAQRKPPISELISDVVTVWKPVKQTALYQALHVIGPTTLSTLPMLAPPCLPASDQASAIAPSGGSDPHEPSHDDQNRRACLSILIAEDNRTNQRVALRMLELLGYRADIVDTGLAVLDALKQQRYDVILMDMRMPELDGIETTHRIRQMSQYADIWIIAMTANAMTRDRQLCFAAGMDDYLSKPINRAALDRALLRCPALRVDPNRDEQAQ